MCVEITPLSNALVAFIQQISQSLVESGDDSEINHERSDC